MNAGTRPSIVKALNKAPQDKATHVIPAKTGIKENCLDTGLHRYDEPRLDAVFRR